jgi:hypothetical protein
MSANVRTLLDIPRIKIDEKRRHPRAAVRARAA